MEEEPNPMAHRLGNLIRYLCTKFRIKAEAEEEEEEKEKRRGRRRRVPKR